MDNVLNDAEREALLGKSGGMEGYLTPEESDALGEIGNICMGSASTALSMLLNRQVKITSPKVFISNKEEFLRTFEVPLVAIQVVFTEGIEGSAMFVIKAPDAAVIADLMMGNDGTSPPQELGEMEISAAAEAMNQMIGSSSTALASLVGRPVNIAPPNAIYLDVDGSADGIPFDLNDPMVVVAFKMTVEDLISTEIMNIMSVPTAKQEAALLLNSIGAEAGETVQESREWDLEPAPPPGEQAASAVEEQPRPQAGLREQPPKEKEAAGFSTVIEDDKLRLFMDIPLKVSVILGRTKRPVNEILSLVPGSIVELSSLADEPVDVLVNDTVVARGEVVVVNENFGVRITSILSPEERIKHLRS
ncbi:flagellar motor switch phosphatase FliY [Desulforudis sp. 1088]|uniref:flagellar motor switch phosphatase FliY n=1 Tax=unclassified Candidatus Desulforudis TaxID=2635950 RepID=UPI003CE5012C